MSRWPANRTLLIAKFVLAFQILLPGTVLHAQTVIGRLLEQGTRRPIASGQIALVDSLNATVDEVVTNSEGRFMLRSRASGSFYIRADGLGYQPKIDGILELDTGGEISIEFFLRPDPLRLDSLVASVSRDPITLAEREYLRRQGFDGRLALGFGDFITPEDLEARLPNDPRTLFQGQAAIRVEVDAYMGQQVIKLKRASGFCDPALFVDGAKIAFAGRDGGVAMEDVIMVEDILAIEIYRRLSSVPLQYDMGGRDTACGVVLVWSR